MKFIIHSYQGRFNETHETHDKRVILILFLLKMLWLSQHLKRNYDIIH